MSLLVTKKMAPFLLKMQLQILLFIRLSGNPVDAERFKQINPSDIVQEKSEVTYIHQCEFISEK